MHSPVHNHDKGFSKRGFSSEQKAQKQQQKSAAQGGRYSSFSEMGNKAKELNYTDPASLSPLLCSSASL